MRKAKAGVLEAKILKRRKCMVRCLVFKSRETKIEDKTFLVLMRLGDTPVPIPNTMVKT